MLLPVQKDQSWFWQMGEAAVDWWDLDPTIPIYCDDSGIVYKQPAKWTTRVVLFDAMGLRDAKSRDKRWEDDSGPVGEGEHRHLVCSQACGHCEQCSQTGLHQVSGEDNSDLPELSSGTSDVEGSHAVLPSRGRKYRRFARKGKGELLRGVQNIKAARLSVLHPESPDFFQLEERSLRSVVESDMQDPRCADYRERLMERFENIFEFPDNILEVDPSLRGSPEDSIAVIHLKQGAMPQRVAPYRTVGVRDTAFRELIAKFFKRGMLEQSHSAWAARAFCVPKPGGKWRLVIDYRYLNSQIDGEQYPLPVIDDIFLKQAKNAIWSIFDLEDGFHQMHLAESSRPYTAFVTPWGLYQWTVLPMGLKTAPQAYQRMVCRVLQDFTDAHGTKPYIDDVCHGTPDSEDNPEFDVPPTEECLERYFREIWQFFEIMERACLTIKPSKFQLFVRRVRFCGQILMKGRRTVDPAKTAAIARWTPEMIRTPTHMKAFLGFVQWYAVYIDHFGHLSAPLTDSLRGLELTKKGKKQMAQSLRAQFPAKDRKGMTPQEICKFKNEIFWTDEMRACFHEIVSQLKSAADLFLPRLDRPFWVRCDSSQYAIGAALEQKTCACPDEMTCSCPLRPVAFFSRKLQGDPGKGQRAWHIREKETFAIVATLYKFRSWLAGQQVKVKVLTDHKSLETWTREDFDTVSGPIGRRGRWHQFLAKFQLEIVYIRGEDQTVPDVLSRWAYPAAHAAPDVSIMGSKEDVAGWEADEREERLWADTQMARGISAEFCQQYGIWYRQFRHAFPAHDCLHPRTFSAQFALHRVHQEERISSDIQESWLRNLRDRFAVPSRMCRSQKKTGKSHVQKSQGARLVPSGVAPCLCLCL